MTGRDDSGRCSFCGREQQEVGSLFSRGEGGICAPCVELAVEAMDREVERSLEPGEKPVRRLQRHVERHRRLSDLLLTFGLLNPGEVPGHLVEALEQAATSSRALEAAIRRWVEGGRWVRKTESQARLTYVASRLVALLQPLRVWRATLPASVPDEKIYAIDQALTALATLARVLKDPPPEGSGRPR
jgi:hypothetical protein